jgi:hypothetical protein
LAGGYPAIAENYTWLMEGYTQPAGGYTKPARGHTKPARGLPVAAEMFALLKNGPSLPSRKLRTFSSGLSFFNRRQLRSRHEFITLDTGCQEGFGRMPLGEMSFASGKPPRSPEPLRLRRSSRPKGGRPGAVGPPRLHAQAHSKKVRMLESKKVNQCNKRAWMRIFRFLTLSLSYFITPPTPPALPGRGRATVLSYEL